MAFRNKGNQNARVEIPSNLDRNMPHLPGLALLQAVQMCLSTAVAVARLQAKGTL